MPHLSAIFLMGPTASGKTRLAIELAQRLPIELISVDSALVYRGMDIGTAKPSPEELARAPHFLIDIIEPTSCYSAAQFCNTARQLMVEIGERGKVPLLVGGTMLYFSALQHGLSHLPKADPAVRAAILARAQQLGWPALHTELAAVDEVTAARIKPYDAQRIERALEIFHLTGRPMSAWLAAQARAGLSYRLLKLALLPSNRVELHRRIAARFDAMLANGLLEEVAQLRSAYPQLNPALPSMRCVGYRQVWQHLDGKFDLATLRNKGIIATRQLAKRQMTWLRGMDDVEVVDCLRPDLLPVLERRLREFLADG